MNSQEQHTTYQSSPQKKKVWGFLQLGNSLVCLPTILPRHHLDTSIFCAILSPWHIWELLILHPVDSNFFIFMARHRDVVPVVPIRTYIAVPTVDTLPAVRNGRSSSKGDHLNVDKVKLRWSNQIPLELPSYPAQVMGRTKTSSTSSEVPVLHTKNYTQKTTLFHLRFICLTNP